MQLPTLQDLINGITKKVSLTEDELFRLTEVLNAIEVRDSIPRYLMDKTCIEISTEHNKLTTFVNFESNKKFICICYLNEYLLSVLSIENVLHTTKELDEKYTDYKSVGNITCNKAFPITLLWFNPNINNIKGESHAVSQLGTIANISRYLEIKNNFVEIKTDIRKITLNSTNRQARRHNKASKLHPIIVDKKTTIIKFPNADVIEKVIMQKYNISKRVVKEHTRTYKNGTVKTIPRKVFYKVITK